MCVFFWEIDPSARPAHAHIIQLIAPAHTAGRLDVVFFQRIGESGRRLMHLVPAPAVRLMKRRVQSQPGVRQENLLGGLVTRP